MVESVNWIIKGQLENIFGRDVYLFNGMGNLIAYSCLPFDLLLGDTPEIANATPDTSKYATSVLEGFCNVFHSVVHIKAAGA